MTKKESAEMMEEVYSIMKATLKSGETLKISGFGNFEVKKNENRRGRNPGQGGNYHRGTTYTDVNAE